MKPSPRTYKREIGVISLVLVFVLAGYAMAGSDPSLIAARSQIVIALALPAFSFAAFAFGADWVSKQTEWGGSPHPTPPPEGEE